MKTKEDVREYAREYYQKNKEKLTEYNRKYREEHREQIKMNHDRFKAKVGWGKYCNERRKARFLRLQASGCINAKNVAYKGATPIYVDTEDVL